MRRSVIAALAAMLLSGCSLSPVIDVDIVQYNKAVSDSGNKLLLLNVLRARDHAPLLFSSVQLVHGALSLGGSASVGVPFGPNLVVSKAANTSSAGLSASESPTFDVSSLDTQDFTRGILQPIDPPVVKYFLDRGDLDAKIILLLFISELADSRGNALSIQPEFATSLQQALAPVVSGQVNGTAFIANAYDELTAVGPPFKVGDGSVKDISTIDQTKYRLLPDESGKPGYYRLYSVSPQQQVAFCLRVEASGDPKPRFVPLGSIFNTASPEAQNAEDERCTKSEIEIEAANRGPSAGAGFERVATRSVEGMIQLLGSVLRWEQKNGRPMTFTDFIGVPGGTATGLFGKNSGDIFFSLSARGDSAAYGVEYDGQTYYVGPVESVAGAPKDHTLEVLALLSKLIDMNKSAKDLPFTQSVQIEQ